MRQIRAGEIRERQVRTWQFNATKTCIPQVKYTFIIFVISSTKHRNSSLNVFPYRLPKVGGLESLIRGILSDKRCEYL